MKTLWFLYILISFSYTETTVERLETYKFDTRDQCRAELNRIQKELIEVYGDPFRLQIYCKQQ
jgi:hypothetical protein